MGAIYEDRLLEISNKLDPILNTLACIKETMERTGLQSWSMIISIFRSLSNESMKPRKGSGRLLRSRSRRRTEEGIMVNVTEMAKEVGMKFSTTLTSAVSMPWVKR